MQTKGTKFEETAIIIRQEEIADDIYSMWLRTEHIAAHAKAGQFVSVYSMREADCFQDRSVSVRSTERTVRSVWYTVWQEREPQNFPACAPVCS